MNAWDDLKASQAVKPAPAAPELSPWEAFKAEQPPTTGEELQQAASSFTQGLLATPLGVAQSAAIGLTHLAGMAGLDWTPLEGGANEFAQSVRDIARVAVPGAERARGDFLADKLPEYLGSGVSFLLPGAYLAKIGVPTTLATMGLGAATQSAAQYQDALQHGADPAAAWKAYLLGGGVGMTEALGGLSSMLGRIDEGSGGALGNALVHGLVEGLEEAGQEGISQFASNLIASHLLKYDKDRELMDQVLENAAGGALSGILLSAATSAALHSTHGLTPATDVAPAKKAQPGGKSLEQVGAEVRGETAPTSPGAPEATEQGQAPVTPATGQVETPTVAPTPSEPGPKASERKQGAGPAPIPETYATTGEPAENSSVQPGDKLGPVQVLPIESLREFNPGKQTDPAKVAEMAEAMKAGKPLGVVIAHREPDGSLVFDDGSNRTAAAKLAGFTHVPVREVNPKEPAKAGAGATGEGPLYRPDRELYEATRPGEQVRAAPMTDDARAWANKRAEELAHGERIEDSTGLVWEVSVQKKGTNAGQKTLMALDDSGQVVGPIYRVDTNEAQNTIARSRPAEKPAAHPVNPSEAPKTSLPPEAAPSPTEPTEARPFHEQAAALLARHALAEGKEALPGVADLARALPAELPGPVSRALKAYRTAVSEDFGEQAAPGARTTAAETKLVEALEEASHPVAGFVATKRKLAEVRAAQAKIGAEYAARLKAGEAGLKIDTALAKDKAYQKLKRQEAELEQRVAEVETRKTPAAPEKSEPFTKAALEKTLGVSKEQAHALHSLAAAMGIDKSRVRLVKGGTPGEGALHQAAPGNWYYSNTLRALDSWQTKGTREQLVAHLKKTKGAQEEMAWIGLADWLADKPKVTRDEVRAFVAQRKVEIHETMLGVEEEVDDDALTLLDEYIDAEGESTLSYQSHGHLFTVQGTSAAGFNVTDDDGNFINTAFSIEGARQVIREHVEMRVSGRQPAKYAQYTSPGGTNYRELLLRLPVQDAGTDAIEAELRTLNSIEGRSLAMTRRMELLRERRAESPGSFRSPHFTGIGNILAHVRVKDRVDNEGRRLLFVEEVQSDWHQRGKREGYSSEADARGLDAELDSFGRKLEKLETEYGEAMRAYLADPAVRSAVERESSIVEAWYDARYKNNPEFHYGEGQAGHDVSVFPKIGRRFSQLTGSEQQWVKFDVLANGYQRQGDDLRAIEAELAPKVGAVDKLQLDVDAARAIYNNLAMRRRAAVRATVADAPFKGASWPRLAMKRVLAYAAEKGYDGVAWTTGKEQADRYNLAKYVKEVQFRPNTHRGDPTGLGINFERGTLFAYDQAMRHVIEQDDIPLDELEQYIGREPARALTEQVREREKVLSAWSIVQDEKGWHMERSDGSRPTYYGDNYATRSEALEQFHTLALEESPISITGLDLQIGGEGMVSFYDRELPAAVADVGKRLGLRVGKTVVPFDDGDQPSHFVATPPAAREKIKAEGFPLFQGPKGAVEFTAAGDAIIRALKDPDVSTGAHELAHVARRFLLNRAVPVEQRAGITDDDITAAEEWAEVKEGAWGPDSEEKFARGFERYLRDGVAPVSRLASLFEKFKAWLTSIYQSIAGGPLAVDVSPAMRAVFDKLVTRVEPRAKLGPPPGAIASRWEALPVPPSLVQGQQTTIELAGEKTLPAHYAALEADELIPSHDARKGFAQNPGGDFNERAYDDPVEGRPFRDTVERIAKNPKVAILASDVPTPTDGPPITTSKAVVLGGNARSMAVQLAYSRGGPEADALRQGMQQAATRFGIDASGLKNPVIVRVIEPGSEGQPGELSRALNEPLTTAKGATTEAVSRGSRVTAEAAVDIARVLGDGTLRDALSDPGKASAILRALVSSGAFSQADIVQLTDPTKGTPTAAGKQVIEDALLGAVIRDVRVLSETPASVRQAIVRALPALVRIKARYHPVVEAVTHAAQGMAVLRESGQPIADALAQQVLPGVDVAWKMDPMGLGIMRSLIGEPPTKTAARFNEAAQKIDDFAAGQGSLFGEENLAPAARLAREFGLTPLEEAGLVEENEDIEEEPGEGRVMLDPGDLPVELQAGHPTDPAVGGGANLGTPIGGRLLGTLKEPAARPKGGLVSRPEIIEALSKVVAAAGGKTPIRWGRLGTRNARGVFKVEPEVIRVQQADNLATAAHEVGHALEKHILGWEKGSPWKKGLIDRPLQKELLGLGKELYGKTKPAGGYKREGFAEFIRLYTMEPATAKAKAPLFFSWFEVHFLGGDRGPIKDALLEVRRLADAWKAQGSKGRAEASIVEPTSLKETVKGLRARLTGDAVITSMVEAGHQLGKLSRAAEQRLGRLLNPTEDPFYLYQALRSTHSARVRQMVESGMVNLAGEKVGPALLEIRGLVEGRYKDFTIYLWARRAVALHASRRDAGISIEDARQLVEELGSTQFELAASKVYEWSDGVLNYAAQASPTFARVVEAIRKKDPGSYLPLQREFSELDSIWGEQKKARGLGAGGGIAKRLKGSGRRIKNPLPVLLANAERTVLSAHRRLVLDQVMKLSQLEGLGHLVEEVPVDQVPVAQATIEEILQRVQQKAGIPPNEGGLELKGTGFHEDTDFSDLLGETITFFAPAQFPKGQDPVIPVWDGKRVRWYAMDHRLASTLAGMDVYRLPKVADLVFGVPARLFRLGTTGLSASFGLVTNPLRDPQTLYKNTASSAWAPRIFIEYVKQLAVAGLHHATGGRYSSPYLDLFLRLGAEMAQPLGMDMRHTERAARRLFQGKAVRILDPRNALDFLRDLFQFPETAARVTEIKLIAREIGWEPGQPMTLDQSLRLLLGAKQSTVDFTAAGNLARVMNQAVPYFNAPIQGLRGEVRAGRRAPGRFLFRGLQITAATLALWWMNKDKEWYRQLSARARALYWAIPFDWNGREELALIPRAQEGPMVFGSLPEAMADAWYRQDPKAASEFFSTLFDQLTPNLLPVVIDEARDQYRNRDSFWDTPLVPTGELRRRPEEQVGEYTSRAAKFLAHMFGKIPGAPEMAKSPRRIDHAMRGAFGGVSRDVVDLLGLGAPRGRGLSEPADAPVIGRLFQRGGALGYRPLAFQRLYDAAEAASQRAASTTLEKESREERDLRLMLEDATATVSALTYVRSQAQDVDQRRALVKEAVDIALDALKNLQEKNPTRGPMRQARRYAERLEERAKP